MNFDLQPTLKGKLLELHPVKKEDFERLYAVASDPLVWEQHPMWDRFKRDIFERFFEAALNSGGAFVVREASTGEVIGSSRYYDLTESEVFIGYTFLARKCWGGSFNREMKSLMLNHAFKYRDVVKFHVGETNTRSQKAMAKIGGKYESTIPRLDHGPDGHPVNSLVYIIEKKSNILEQPLL
jgi:N-acetyltransferase